MNTTLDLTYLTKMMDGDETLVAKFVNIFKIQAPQQLDELKTHFQNQDWKGLSQVAHSLKTQFTYLSVESMAEQARVMESLAEEGQRQELFERLQAFEEEFVVLIQGLK